MKWFANMRMAYKLGLGFGLCILGAVTIGLVALTRMAQMNTNAGLLRTDAMAGMADIVDVVSAVRQTRQYEFRLGLSNTPALRADADRKIDDAFGKADAALAAYEKDSTQAEDRENLRQLRALWDDYKGLDKRFRAMIARNDQAGAVRLCLGDAFEAFHRVTDLVDKMVDWNNQHGDALAGEADKAYKSARTTVIGILIACFLLAGLVGMAITRSLTSTVGEISKRIESMRRICLKNLAEAVIALSKGDLTAKIETGTTPINLQQTDELGLMAADVNGMVEQTQGTIDAFRQAQDNLSKMIASARGTADSVATASNQLSAGNEDLSQRTTEQASSLEETASSMEEMTSTVKQNAENAREANQLAAQAREVAERGGAVVSSAVSSMEEINTASKRIADIISVIDEIAFQTNLLALNAAVEAARVGEQGRGFAVVAAEVRNLAGRSATAAKEIKALVQDTVGKVHDGTELVNQSGEQLTEIVRSIQKVADIIAEISAASQEQSAGIDQVNKAVIQMDQITQQNAALVEEAASSSRSIAGQARSLQQTVTQFRLDQSYLMAMPSSQPAAPAHESRATGTNGRPAPARGGASGSKLRLTSHEADGGFEEF